MPIRTIRGTTSSVCRIAGSRWRVARHHRTARTNSASCRPDDLEPETSGCGMRSSPNSSGCGCCPGWMRSRSRCTDVRPIEATLRRHRLPGADQRARQTGPRSRSRAGGTSAHDGTGERSGRARAFDLRFGPVSPCDGPATGMPRPRRSPPVPPRQCRTGPRS